MTLSPELSARLHRLRLVALTTAVMAGALCAYGYVSLPDRFYAAYLTAFMYWLGIALGCLAVALVHGMTGGAWGLAIRRIVEAGSQTLPLMALLFLPLWLGASRIYEWADPQALRQHAVLARKAGYLNVPGYQVRPVIYFGVWFVITWLMMIYSPRSDRDADSSRALRLQRISGMGFIVYGFSFTLAAVDWMMSLEPEWFSTMYGLIQIAGQGVAGLSFALVVVAALGAYEPWSRIVTPLRLNDLGNLLLASVMFWAYTSFFQYLVIWSGNLPEENVWYLHRSAGVWKYLAMGLITLHFAVPFLLLLSRRLKRHTTDLCRIAGLLLVMRYVDLYWTVVPGFQRGSADLRALSFHWLDVAALAAIGGAWLTVFAWRLSVRAALPIYDLALKERSSG